MPHAEERFPLLPATRWLIPAAAALAVLGLLFSPGGALRLVWAALTAVVIALWILLRARRPVLVVQDGGYHVEVRGRRLLRVRFDEVRAARAVPAEQAIYVDCGDPARNLLVPPHGYGFRFARQPALYALLADRLADRLEIVDRLAPDAPPRSPP